MIRVTGINEIMFTRGDTLPLEIKIRNKLTKKEYQLNEHDKLQFVLETKVFGDEEPEVVLSKTNEEDCLFVFVPADTKELECGKDKYTYGVKLTTEDGEVCTVVDKTDFVLVEEVGRNEQ